MENSTIPSRIIQIWAGGRKLPLLSKACVENIRLLNPDFEYLLFDDALMEKFIVSHFPEFHRVFNSFRFPVQRYDFFRYLAVYHYGGFYFDMDMLLASCVAELQQLGCVFPFEALTINSFLREEYGMDWEIGTYAFGSTANHPFLHRVIENCVRAQEDKEWYWPMFEAIPGVFRGEFSVIYTTGPGLVSRTLAEYQDAAKHVKVLFPENVCDTNYWNRFGDYGIHMKEGKWRKRKGFFRRRLIAAWMLIEEKKAVKKCLKQGRRRSLRSMRSR